MSNTPLKLAIVGFRHGHIDGQVNAAKELDNLELVATCEENTEARAALEAQNLGVPVFDSYEKLLANADCDIIGIGDYFGIRGQRAITALEHGKHVLSDKPLCTDLDELNTIKVLSSEKNLQVGCQLDIRGNGTYRRLRRLICDDELGEIHALSFGGQHPLNLGSRPEWYFEDGKQGGTINDIAIHAFDFIPWITGQPFSEVVAAREWNATVPQYPAIREAAQIMLTLQNGCGVQGDVSYLVPDSFGYTLPQYWRISVWGEKGLAECNTSRTINFYRNGDTEKQVVQPDEDDGMIPIKAFLQEIAGEKNLELSTAEVLRASYVSLSTQKAADEKLTYVKLD
ncbi:MAG: Gfo/Idh/MocA family oxidoreductase [Abditibacteriaceae bacterium]